MSVEFDPVRLDRRRRRVEPAVIGIIVVAVGIGTAIAKPWDPTPNTSPPAPSEAAVAATQQPPSATPSPSPTSSSTQDGPDWLAVTNAVTEHDGWGVTAVLRHGSAPAGPTLATTRLYTELWTPTSQDASGTDMAVLSRDGADIAALGITVPDGVQPRGVRFWRLHQNDEFEWVNAARIDDQAQSHAPLLVRMPLLDGVDSVPWEAGQYRADVLIGDGVHRISVVVAKQFGDVPGPDDWPISPAVVAAAASDPSGITSGLFATVDGGAVSIPALQSEPLGEAQAWGDTAVVSTYLPRATGLGVMLTARAAVEAASISRLAPEPLSDPPVATGGVSNLGARTPFVVFQAPEGVWTPGVYAVSVDWKDAAGAHHGTWHVELLPGVG